MVTVTGSLFATDFIPVEDSYNPAVCDGLDGWIDLDLLFWKPWEKALVVTNVESDVFVTDDFTQTPLVHPHFKWDLGYRLNAGYLFACDLWDVEASWTHFLHGE